jgi:hypothetical protein
MSALMPSEEDDEQLALALSMSLVDEPESDV